VVVVCVVVALFHGGVDWLFVTIIQHLSS
jgi:hypothetical protein